MSKNLKSWKTTLPGLGAICTALGVAITAYTDNDPATVPNWGGIVTLVLVGLVGLFAKDGDKSTEDVS